MSSLLAVLALGACAHPALDTLEEERRGAACELLAQQPPPPSSLSRATLLGLYELPEFERARDRDSGALGVAVKRALEWLMTLFESTAAEHYAQGARVVVLVLGAAASLAALAWAARWRRAAPKVTSASSAQGSHAPLAPDRLHEAQALLLEAPREAMRLGLLALLSWLEAAGLARADRVETNREISEQLPHRGAPLELDQALAGLLRGFDRAFYSLGPISVEEARRFLETVTRLTASPLVREQAA